MSCLNCNAPFAGNNLTVRAAVCWDLSDINQDPIYWRLPWHEAMTGQCVITHVFEQCRTELGQTPRSIDEIDIFLADLELRAASGDSVQYGLAGDDRGFLEWVITMDHITFAELSIMFAVTFEHAIE